MKDKKRIILITNIVILFLGIILINRIANAAKTNADNQHANAQRSNISGSHTQSLGTVPTAMETQSGQTGILLQLPNQRPALTATAGTQPSPTAIPVKAGQPSPTVIPTIVPTQPIPTAVPTQPIPTIVPTQPIPTAVPTQPIPTAVPTQAPQPPTTGSTAYRYFSAGTPVSAIQAGAAGLSKQQVKVLIEKEVDGSWGVIQNDLGFSTKEKAYAFFLGMSSRESTLNAALETGSGPAHSYGALQTAETAYAGANPNYLPETDVPEMTQFSFVPENFYDPGISIYMGIRHIIHYGKQAQAAGYTGIELLRHELIGYNTGFVTNSNTSWLVAYSDEIGSLAGWYLTNMHLYDAQFTYTGDPNVNRSQPWSWY